MPPRIMAAAALRKWQLLLTELQLLQAKLSAGQACDAADVRALEHAAADAPCFDTLSVAHVKAAVQEQQVPYKLYTLFTALHPSNPQLGPVFATALARSLALTLDPNLLLPGQALYSTTVSLWRQVLLSGLLLPEHLPSLLAATAVQLDAGLIPFGATIPTHTCPVHGSSSRGTRQQGASSSGRRGAAGSRGSMAARLACSCVNDSSTDLLTALGDIKMAAELANQGNGLSDTLPASVYAAGMQLALAGIRAVSRAVEQQPADMDAAHAKALEQNLTIACQTAFCTLRPCAKTLSAHSPTEPQQPGGSGSGPVVDAEQRVLLQSAHFIQGVALMVGMSACTYLFLSAAAAAYIAMKRDSTSSSSDAVKQQLYEWQSEVAMDRAWETASVNTRCYQSLSKCCCSCWAVTARWGYGVRAAW